MGVYLRVGAVLAMAILSAAAGMWIGDVTAPRTTVIPAPLRPLTPGLPAEGEPVVEPPDSHWSPVLFHGGTRFASQWGTAASEILMAAEAGFHEHVVDVPLPWTSHFESVDDVIDLALKSDPLGTLMLNLNLNPPTVWLEEHKTEVAVTGDPKIELPSIASQVWIEEVAALFDELMSHLRSSRKLKRVRGAILRAQESGEWFSPVAYDRSEVNLEGFRSWLAKRYGTDEGLAEAWGRAQATLAGAEIPPQPVTDDTARVFYPIPAGTEYADYLRYVSETTASVIRKMSEAFKKSAGDDKLVWVPYGYSLDTLDNGTGHFAASALASSTVDAFLSPISDSNRGAGGVCAFAVPVDSMAAWGKGVFLYDDTRTGLALNGARGRAGRTAGMSLDGVLDLFRRNLATAALFGSGWIAADTDGEGRLNDRGLWRGFETLRKTYETHANVNREDHVTLLLAIDEESRFYQQCDGPLNALLVRGVRDAALEAGVSVAFALVQDILAGRTPLASVYLFPNLFHLSATDRTRLHSLLKEQKSAAIWLYAPGYIRESPSPDHVALTTRMGVKTFEEPHPSGSQYAFGGDWIGENDEFGADMTLSPSFYIEDESVDVLAYYADSEIASAAIKFLEDGWTSVYICEPALPVVLLREILSILEIPTLMAKTSPVRDASMLRRGNLALIHAGAAGERTLDLGGLYDVEDLLDPTRGWIRKRLLTLPIKRGETRFLKLTPLDTPKPQALAELPGHEQGLPQ